MSFLKVARAGLPGNLARTRIRNGEAGKQAKPAGNNSYLVKIISAGSKLIGGGLNGKGFIGEEN